MGSPKICGDKVKAVLKGKFIEGNTLEMREDFKSIILKNSLLKYILNAIN